jgi:hypothetical protein
VLTGLWVDASNYTGAFTDQMMADLKAAGVKGIIVQAITGADGTSYTRQQCQMAVSHGFLLGGYVWCFPGENQASIDGRLAMFDGFPLAFLWADVEQTGTTVADVNLLLARCDAYTGQQTGVYTGKWFFDQQGWSGLTLWSNRPLWVSIYDGQANVLIGFVPFGGWTACVVKQYAGSSSIGSVHMIDLDVAA